MVNKPLHSWNLTPQEAIKLQRELAQKIIREDKLATVRYIAGADMAIKVKTNKGHAVVVVYTYPALELVEYQCHEELLSMPYMPGLLSFREIPVMLGAFDKLHQKPDLIFVDGMGIAHPRRIGIASHLGLWLNIPTIGCGKTLLVGKYDEKLLDINAGSWVPLLDKGEIIGAVVRTRTRIRPLIISLGHMISLQTSIYYVLSCMRGYRLPEPVRQADKLSRK